MNVASKQILETGINRLKTETENKFKNEIRKNWKPVLNPKPKPKKI